MLDQYKQAHLREVQLRELEILTEIDRLCRREGIPYWLDGGTLLGAVRHGGFIPWDDDVDIAMPLDQLPRFIELAQRELPPHLLLQAPGVEGEDVRMPLCKVRDRRSFLVEYGDDFARHYHKGIYVDIFPMQPYPSVPRPLVKHLAGGYCRANAILHAQHYYSLRSLCQWPWFALRRAYCRTLWSLCKLLRPSGEYYCNTLENNGYGITHRRDAIFPLGTILFEGHPLSAPANPDAYLTDLYHDYRQLPPEDKRGGHAVFYCLLDRQPRP